MPISAPPPGQPGMLCERYRLPRKGNPQRKPLLPYSLLSSSTEACLSRFPILELAGSARGEASTPIAEVLDGSLATPQQARLELGELQGKQ